MNVMLNNYERFSCNSTNSHFVYLPLYKKRCNYTSSITLSFILQYDTLLSLHFIPLIRQLEDDMMCFKLLELFQCNSKYSIDHLFEWLFTILGQRMCVNMLHLKLTKRKKVYRDIYFNWSAHTINKNIILRCSSPFLR